jgi:hypothetical protein
MGTQATKATLDDIKPLLAQHTETYSLSRQRLRVIVKPQDALAIGTMFVADIGGRMFQVRRAKLSSGEKDHACKVNEANSCEKCSNDTSNGPRKRPLVDQI